MDRSELKTAAEVIRSGGIVAYPTESCYGLGCDPMQHRAIRRLLRIKRRQWQQGLIIIAARLQQLLRYLESDPGQAKRVGAEWPRPVTWLMPVRPGVSRWLIGTNPAIAMRVTAHPGAAALCNHARTALISTSANRHNRLPARSAKAVYREFGDEIDFILAGNLGGQVNPSEIRDAVTNQVLRG